MTNESIIKMSNSESHIGIINPKSPSNVGSIMRASGCYQVSSVSYTGKRYARASQFITDTQSASLKIPLTQVESFFEYKPPNTQIVCVELVEGAIPLPDFHHPERAFYIFGPEDGSIDQELINIADEVVYIPTIGCMNLAATVNVVLYDRLAKTKSRMGGDALIRQSRDTNNNLKA